MKARKKKSHTKEILHRLFKNKLAVAGLVVIILLVLVAIFAPFLAPYGYEVQDLTATYQFPNGTHLLGTEQSRTRIFKAVCSMGTRQSLRIGVLSVAIASICGINTWIDRRLLRRKDRQYSDADSGDSPVSSGDAAFHRAGSARSHRGIRQRHSCDRYFNDGTTRRMMPCTVP